MSVAEKIKELFVANQDQTGDTFCMVKVTAQIRMISTIKGKQLSPFEDFKLKWFLVTWDEQTLWSSTFPEINEALVNTAVRTQAVMHFINKLRSDTTFKRSVGGTKWSVDVKDMVFEKVEYDFWNNQQLIKSGLSPVQKLEQLINQDQEDSQSRSVIHWRGW